MFSKSNKRLPLQDHKKLLTVQRGFLGLLGLPIDHEFLFQKKMTYIYQFM